MWYSLCIHDDEQITSEQQDSGWVHTVWTAIGQPPTIQAQCPTNPETVATPTEGVLVQYPAEGGGA